MLAELPSTPLLPGATFDLAWTWRPQTSLYRDHYRATLQLVDSSTAISLTEFDLGGNEYPSSQWATGYPLRQMTTVTLPADIPSGSYDVTLVVSRAADGNLIPARRPWRIGEQPRVTVGAIVVSAP